MSASDGKMARCRVSEIPPSSLMQCFWLLYTIQYSCMAFYWSFAPTVVTCFWFVNNTLPCNTDFDWSITFIPPTRLLIASHYSPQQQGFWLDYDWAAMPLMTRDHQIRRPGGSEGNFPAHLKPWGSTFQQTGTEGETPSGSSLNPECPDLSGTWIVSLVSVWNRIEFITLKHIFYTFIFTALPPLTLPPADV